MIDKSAYRPSVGVVLLNQARNVFMAQRLDSDRFGWLNTWQFPQGGIDEGETASVAALRELQEETGVTSVQIIDVMPQWLYYDLPADLAAQIWGGKYKGQKQKWFLCRFLGNDAEINLGQNLINSHAEFANWEWADFQAAPNRVVPFKMDVYKEVVSYFSNWFK